MSEPCPFCGGDGWTVEIEVNPNCTVERCAEPCPLQVAVPCRNCDGTGEARDE